LKRTINETIPVKIRAEFWSIFKYCAIGIKGPIPICIIFITISLLSLLYFLKTIDIKKIENKYNKITDKVCGSIEGILNQALNLGDPANGYEGGIIEQRKKDKLLGQRQIIDAKITSIKIVQRSKNRIAADVDLNYKDKMISSSGEILSETVIPSLKVKYIIGKNKNNWQVVDYISGN